MAQSGFGFPESSMWRPPKIWEHGVLLGGLPLTNLFIYFFKATHGETEELRAKQRELTKNFRAEEKENKELSDVMAALKDKIHLLG